MSAYAGIRIIDFTQGIAGPMATMLFGDFEAEVLKVEPPGGDRMKDHPGYICWNRNKQRLALDLHTYDGLRRARELLAGADVAVFDAVPGELERLGLDATTVCAANASLIHAWLPPYGVSGRWSQLPPDDGLLMALSGCSFLQPSFAGTPVHLVTPQLSYAHAAIAANAIAAALIERQRSGLGQAVTVSGLNAVAAVQSAGAIKAGEVMRVGGRSSRGGWPHYRLYRCADSEWFFLGTLTAPFFLKALDALGLMEVMTMEGVEGEFTNMLRPEIAPRIMEKLEARIAEKPREEWLQILQDAGVPKGPVGAREEWFRGETVAANHMRLEVEHPSLGRVELPGVPVVLEGTPGSVRHLLQEAAPEPSRRPAPLVPAAQSPAGNQGPLAGVRVIDVGAFIAGTFAPTVLANFGAEVVKVEPLEGDPFRPYGLTFIGHNQGKRSLTLDMKAPAGREVFYELVRQCDIVLDNYRLGVRERLGIDYATLSAINPRIITCSVTGYGREGPLARDPGFDPLMQARSGMMAAQGGDDEPIFHQIAVNDTATAMMAAFGMSAALHARARSGRGQEVHTSLANQSILFQSGELTWYEGRPPNQLGGLDYIGPRALQRHYECADGWLAISCTAPEHFQQVCVALGHPEWAGRSTAEQALRETAASALAEGIAAALRELPRDDALDRLLARGVPCALTIRYEEIFSDPWLAAEGLLTEREHPLFGAMSSVRSYGEFSRTPGGFAYRAPLAGEHSLELLREFGFEDGRVAALVQAGVVRQG
ncbi:MAG: CoA transferase [Tepidiformaceae bacterium]